MKNRIQVSILMLLLFVSTATFAKSKAIDRVYYLINSEQMLTSKKALLNDSRKYKEIVAKADKLLNIKVFSVTNKTTIPPSGDKHDYISIAPYFWPDPTKKEGKPYLRRDGEVNPETRKNTTDYAEFEKFTSSVSSLSYAAFMCDNAAYSDKAIELLKAWFVNPATKMNPNLNFGQAVPGESLGRPFGIIEMMDLIDIMKAIETLELSKKLDNITSKDYRNWFYDYSKWLTTSELGVLESKSKNNHGTTYDVQLCSIYFFLQKTKEAKQLLESVKANRIDSQLASDGSQPHELERTKSISYSTMNLSAMTTLARYGRMVDVDLWNYTSVNGSSLKSAYLFLSKALDKDYQWRYKQIADPKGTKIKLAKLFIQTGESFKDSTLTAIGKKYLQK